MAQDGVRFPRHSGIVAVLLIATLAAVAGFAVTWQIAQQNLQKGLEQSLILTRRAVETEIDRFRSLPRIAGEDARILTAIRAPDDPISIAAANQYLETIARHSGATHLYLMNAEGRAIAASNWATEQSFVGQDYSFRPYFREALTRGAGQFYAIGVTTRTPGYFLASRVAGGARGPGVIVIKIDLLPLQQTWANARLATALADADGVVFLSAEPAWLYRPLAPLSPDTVARLLRDRTYDGLNPQDKAALFNGPQRRLLDGRGQQMYAALAPIPGENWQLLAAAPLAPVWQSAVLWAFGAALLSIAVTGMAKIAHQRRQLTTLRLRQSALLERKVTERTQALGREIEARRQTEAELRAAQETLVHSEKMAALGRMSAAIVHEISQPLAAMEATLAAAELSLQADTARTATRIDTARNLIRRMQRTTRHLKSFSRKDTGALTLIAVGAVIESALELVRPRARAVGVEPRYLAGTETIQVLAGAIRLEQVCVNLLLNALDAVETNGGEVTIALSRSGAEVRIAVHDTGPGIDAAILPRITEPFFTTKHATEGLGLGLAISQAIVAEFHGRLEVISTPGEGTTVTVVLPATAKETAA